jgi:hypothetical protein
MNWVLLLAACTPHDAEVTGSFHTWLADGSSATIDLDKLPLEDATLIDCRWEVGDEASEAEEGSVCNTNDPDNPVVNPNDPDGELTDLVYNGGGWETSPFMWLYNDAFWLKQGKLDPWRSEALITSEGDFQLTFHHQLPGKGGDFRVAFVIDPTFEPEVCIQSGWTCYSPDTEPTDDDGDGWYDNLDPDCFEGAWEVGFKDHLPCNDGIDNDGDGAIDGDDSECEHPWSAAEERSCIDGTDNDGDSWTDERDPDCLMGDFEDGNVDGVYLCNDGIDNDGDGDADNDDGGCASAFDDDEGGPESSDTCSDSYDNDGDGWTDTLDPDCHRYGAEAGWTPQIACNDGIDNDGDSLVDADDPGCFTSGGHVDALRPTEADIVEGGSCDDKDGDDAAIDNDGDGWANLDDPDCWFGNEEDGTFNGLTECNDGLDNDSTGGDSNDTGDASDGIDAEDADCANAFGNNESVGPQNNSCVDGDGADEDNDGWANDADPDCWTDDAKEAGISGFACNDFIDNDEDGLTDSEDPGCTSADRLTEVDLDSGTDCADGVDNDGDGWTDAADGGCLLGDFEADDFGATDCADGVDNDLYDVDAADLDCQSPFDVDEADDDTCNDELDNDGDGWTDASDPDCGTAGYEIGYAAAQCNNGLDDDGDSNIDAEDDGCASAFDTTETATDECADAEDNDGDGWTDGADPDCIILNAGLESNTLAPAECSDGADNDGDGDVDAADADCSSAFDNIEATDDPGEPRLVEIDDAPVLEMQSADEDGTIYYLNAGAYQLNPSNSVDYWYLPDEWRSGFARAKFAEEEFALSANDFVFLDADYQNPDDEAYDAAAQYVADVASLWQAEPETYLFLDPTLGNIEYKVEDNSWREIDSSEAGLDNWAEVHSSWVRIDDGAKFEPGGHVSGDFQIYMVGVEADSKMLVTGSFDTSNIREDRWSYGVLEDELYERNQTVICE